MGEVIDLLDDACRNFKLQGPAAGCDLRRHHYREGNDRADRLNWEIRHLPLQSRYRSIQQHLNNTETLIAIRGAYDGGVSSGGAGGGWWLDGEFISEQSGEG
eukprot:6823935-Pyramimonas_sp.AAC.1